MGPYLLVQIKVRVPMYISPSWGTAIQAKFHIQYTARIPGVLVHKVIQVVYQEQYAHGSDAQHSLCRA